MPHGLQIINDQGEISLDEEYNSHFAYLTIDPAECPGNGWTSNAPAGYPYSASTFTAGPSVFIPSTLDVIVWVRPKAGWDGSAQAQVNAVWQFFSLGFNFDGTGFTLSNFSFLGFQMYMTNYEIMISLGANALRSVQARQSTYGLEVYNSAGNIVFASDMKNLNILGAAAGNTFPTTITFPTQTKSVWVAISPTSGLGSSSFVGGPNIATRYMNRIPSVFYKDVLQNSVTVTLQTKPYQGAFFYEDATLPLLTNRVVAMACTF